uniref:Uncharacterized protein n=1 Tax=Amphora coffeiformis TaxID=265554 RepID=A0A7S3L4Y2_9STRA
MEADDDDEESLPPLLPCCEDDEEEEESRPKKKKKKKKKSKDRSSTSSLASSTTDKDGDGTTPPAKKKKKKKHNKKTSSKKQQTNHPTLEPAARPIVEIVRANTDFSYLENNATVDKDDKKLLPPDSKVEMRQHRSRSRSPSKKKKKKTHATKSPKETLSEELSSFQRVEGNVQTFETEEQQTNPMPPTSVLSYGDPSSPQPPNTPTRHKRRHHSIQEGKQQWDDIPRSPVVVTTISPARLSSPIVEIHSRTPLPPPTATTVLDVEDAEEPTSADSNDDDTSTYYGPGAYAVSTPIPTDPTKKKKKDGNKDSKNGYESPTEDSSEGASRSAVPAGTSASGSMAKQGEFDVERQAWENDRNREETSSSCCRGYSRQQCCLFAVFVVAIVAAIVLGIAISQIIALSKDD